MSTPSKPMLLLLPNLLADLRHHQPFLPASVDRAVEKLDGMIAESITAGRRYLGRFTTKVPQHTIPIAICNSDTPPSEIDFLLQPLRDGECWGVLSDNGLPCLADPGSMLVARARSLGIAIRAFAGPSSISMALMLSGLPAQRFFFRGYLHRDKGDLSNEIMELERESQQRSATQIFIEAPHRNQKLLCALFETLSPESLLCVASELTTERQSVVCQTISQWRKSPPPNLSKKNSIFCVYSGADSYGSDQTTNH